MRSTGPSLALLPLLVMSLSCASAPPPTEVLVMGMIHSGHARSQTFGVDVVQDLIRRIEPDYLLVEIPPDRMEAAVSGFQETGELTEPRASRFVEYKSAIFPLTRELDFEMIPCAGWTREMADSRSALLDEWQTTRADDSTEVGDAQDAAVAAQKAEGLDNLLGIHTARYDDLVKQGMGPYDRLFNDDLGPGGWTNINAAHYAHIAAALDAHKGEGKRFVVTFGSWHKYWFLEQLALRDDVKLLELRDFVEPAL